MNAHAEIHHDMEGDEPDLQIETLAGDMRDEMLSRVKHLKATWNLLSQQEQAEVANGLELFAKQMVRRAVHLVTRQEFPHTAVKLAEMKIKGGKDIEAKIVCDNIEHNRSVLGEHIGQLVQIVMIDSDVFMGERDAVKTDPDQPDLPLEGDAGADTTESDGRRALPPPSKGDSKPRPEDLE